MNYVDPKHREEWIASGVDSEIIDLNVISLKETEAFDRLLYGLAKKERRNDGRLRDKWLKRYKHLEYGGWWCNGVDPLTGNDSIWGQFKPNQPYLYDLIKHCQQVSKAQFHEKENSAKITTKTIKYEAPAKVPTEIIALRVNFLHSWNIVSKQNETAKIAWIQRFWNATQEQCDSKEVSKDYCRPDGEDRERNKISESRDRRGFGKSRRENEAESFPTFSIKEFQEACKRRKYREIDRILQAIWNRSRHRSKFSKKFDRRAVEKLVKRVDKDFWFWVIDSDIPLTITEGAKKAGSLLTAGYVAIALPGIYSGYRQAKDEWGNKVGDRKLIPQLQIFAQKDREIVFCFDRDIKFQTIKNVRTAISYTGKLFAQAGCRVSVIRWEYPFKGVDDLIVAKGIKCFTDLYKLRNSLTQFNLAAIYDLSKYNLLELNERYLGRSLVSPEDARIIGLRSPKGTGKTEWLVGIVDKATAEGRPVLVITHRIQLAKALCYRFGIDHIEEVRTSATKGAFGYGLCIDSLHSKSQARFDPEDWHEAVVILDEAEQVIWHLLDSSTCQDNRVTIIENFKRLLQVASKIYVSDADLSCISIDYVQKLTGQQPQTWIAKNTYSGSKRKLINYSDNDPSKLIAASVNAIEQGDKILMHTSGQKVRSKWGSINLESYFKQQFPNLSILRIDRDSICNPTHPAYGCMTNLDILSNYDIVIASPVIETGVSIDLKGHFDSVWAIAWGVQTVDAVCQTLARLREEVPRHVWAKATAKGNRIGNGSTSIKRLLASQHKLTTANINLLQRASIKEFDDLNIDFSPESLVTWAKRACVVNTGKNNYREAIIAKLVEEDYEPTSAVESEVVNSSEIKEQIGNVRDRNYHTYCQAVPQAVTPTDTELEKLNNKKVKTEQERLIEKKGNLIKRYGIKVTPELIKRDDDGWYGKLQIHYYLSLGERYLAQRDRRSLSQIEDCSYAFKPDINKKQLLAKVWALKLIDIEQFLDPDAEFDKDSLASWLEKIILLRFDIQSILGVSINPERDSAIAVAQRLLKKLGLKLEFTCQTRSKGKRIRVYKGCNLNSDGRETVFINWLVRDDGTPFS